MIVHSSYANARGRETRLEKRGHTLEFSKLARKMGTSRAAVDRLLDPTNHSATLHTLESAAADLGKRLSFHLA